MEYSMKRCLLSAVCAMVVASASAQLGSSSSTTYNYYSEVQDSPAWQKDVITADGTNYTTLRDRQGALASKQSLVALDIAISNVSEVAIAFKEGFDAGISNLVEATNNVPLDGLTIGLVLPLSPSETRTAIEGYIVEQAYDAERNIDKLSIHFTQSMAVEPRIVCPYVSESGMTTNLLTGTFRHSSYLGSNWTNKFSVTSGDITYDNCHMLYVERPSSLQGLTVWFDSHVRWGTNSGIDYGNIVHTAYGEELYTGALTNYENFTYITVSDGAITSDGFLPFPAVTNVTGSGYVSGSVTNLVLDGSDDAEYLFHGANLSTFTMASVVYNDNGTNGTDVVMALTYTNGVLSATMEDLDGSHSNYQIVMSANIGTVSIPVTFQTQEEGEEK